MRDTERTSFVILACLVGMFLIGSCGRAHAQALPKDVPFTASEWFVLSAHALDAASTQHCLGSGRCREVNPWLARYESPVAFTAAKFAIAPLQLWLTRKVYRAGHRRLAIVTNVGVGLAFSAIAIRNERVGRVR